MHQILADAIARAAPYAGRFAKYAVSRVAAYIAVQTIGVLRREGLNLPASTETVIGSLAAMLAARGMSPQGAAMSALYDRTGISVEAAWNPENAQPLTLRRCPPPTAPASEDVPGFSFAPPEGPQTTLMRRLAEGRVPPDSVSPMFP